MTDNNGIASSNKIDVIIIEHQDFKESIRPVNQPLVFPSISELETIASESFPVFVSNLSEADVNDNVDMIVADFDGSVQVAPETINIVRNSTFDSDLSFWDSPNSFYDSDFKAAILNPTTGDDYSLAQEVNGDPLLIYCIRFYAAIRDGGNNLPSSTNIRLVIRDVFSGEISVDVTYPLRIEGNFRNYDIRNVRNSRIEFYTDNLKVAIKNVSVYAGPLISSNLANYDDIDNFQHNVHCGDQLVSSCDHQAWYARREGETYSVGEMMFADWDEIGQSPTDPQIRRNDGLLLKPDGSGVEDSGLQLQQRRPMILASSHDPNSVDFPDLSFIRRTQPSIGEMPIAFAVQGQITGMDWGYQSSASYMPFIWYVTQRSVDETGISYSPALVRFNRVLNRTLVSYLPFEPHAIRKNVTSDFVYVTDIGNNDIWERDLVSHIWRRMNLNLSITPKGMAYNPTTNQLLVVGVDSDFSDVMSSVYLVSDVGSGSETIVKSHSREGIYNSAEYVERTNSWIIGKKANSGGVFSLVFLNTNGAFFGGVEVPDSVDFRHICADQNRNGSRDGTTLTIADYGAKTLFSFNTTTSVCLQLKAEADFTAAVKPIYERPPRSVIKNLPFDSTKWYLIDSDVSTHRSDGFLGPTPGAVRTVDGRLRNVNLMSDIFFGSGGLKKGRNDIIGRAVLKPFENSINVGEIPTILDAGGHLFFPGEESPDYWLMVHGFMISEIDMNNITVVDFPNEIKDMYTFYNNTEGWFASDNENYDSEIDSISLNNFFGPDYQPCTKQFFVSPYRRIKVGVSISGRSERIWRKINYLTVLFRDAQTQEILFEKDINKIDQPVEDTTLMGYFEVEYIPTTSNVIVELRTVGESRLFINYVAVVYTPGENPVFDPCGINNIKATINFKSVPDKPYNIYGIVMKYGLRSYDDPSVKAQVSVSYDTIEPTKNGCYVWARNLADKIDPMYPNSQLVGSANVGDIIDVSSNEDFMWAAKAEITDLTPAVELTFPSPNISHFSRQTSGDSSLLRTIEDLSFIPSIIESVEVCLLISSAFNLEKSYSFSTDCNSSDQSLSVDLSYFRAGDDNPRIFSDVIDLETVFQDSGVDSINGWDQLPFPNKSGAKINEARWESFKIELDLLDNTGRDQCSLIVDSDVPEYSMASSNNISIDRLNIASTQAGYLNPCSVFLEIEHLNDETRIVQILRIVNADGGNFNLLLNDIVGVDLFWDVTAEQIQTDLQSNFLTPLTVTKIVDSPNDFPEFEIVYESISDFPTLTAINNLTCTTEFVRYVPPGPYCYLLPKPEPSLNPDHKISGGSCTPTPTKTIKVFRESLNSNCLVDLGSAVYRFVKKPSLYQILLFADGQLFSIPDNHVFRAGDTIVLLHREVEKSNIIIKKIQQSLCGKNFDGQ